MSDTDSGGNKNRRVQIRANTRGWNERRRRIFLDHLAATCNVRMACDAVGLTREGVYQLRRRDAVFAEQWRTAIRSGYELIEAAAMAKVLAAQNGELPAREEGDPIPPNLDDIAFKQAMDILAHYRAATAGGRRANGKPERNATKAELIAAILKRLDRIDEQEARRQAASDPEAPPHD